MSHPYGFQHLLGRAQWDADGVQDAARAQVIHALADAEGVLIVDETGFLKKAAIPPGYSANTVARRAGSRTVRSACFWPMPVVGDRVDRPRLVSPGSVVGGSRALSAGGHR